MTGGSNPETFYTHRDHLGSSSAVTDLKGTVRRWYANRPYGEEWRISAEAVTDFEYGETPEERGWSVYDPAGTLSIVYDPERKGRVLKLSTTEGTGFGVTYSGGLARFTDMRLGEEGLRVAVKVQGSFVFYVRVADTTGKQWYLTYKPETGSPVLSGEYYTIKLGASYADGSWRTIERNLREDLLAETGAVFDHVVWVCVRGALSLDDLWFHSTAQVLPPRDVDEHRFTGKETDRGTGLVYFGARYYDPEVGRWTTVDPGRQGLNWYVYCNDNPLKYVDPDGRWVDTAVDIVSLGISINDLRKDPGNIWNWVSLVADVGGLILPVACGGGLTVKGLTKVDDVVDAAKTLNKADNAADAMAAARKAGKIGENLAGIVKNTTRIDSITGTATFRVPDELSSAFLREIKNVKYQPLTNQIKDYLLFCKREGLQFILETRTGKIEDLSGPLRKLVESGDIILRKIGE